MTEINDREMKAEICKSILNSLPSWFGNEEAVADYANKVKDMPFCCVYVGGKPVGFVAVKDHNEYTAEVCVMGILKEYHRQGIGRALINYCEEYCHLHSKEFLTVKTLDESRPSKSYQQTRQFYIAMGFRPLEVFPLHWDADNPCLFMAKHIGKDSQTML